MLYLVISVITTTRAVSGVIFVQILQHLISARSVRERILRKTSWSSGPRQHHLVKKHRICCQDVELQYIKLV